MAQARVKGDWRGFTVEDRRASRKLRLEVLRLSPHVIAITNPHGIVIEEVVPRGDRRKIFGAERDLIMTAISGADKHKKLDRYRFSSPSPSSIRQINSPRDERPLEPKRD